MRKCHRKVCYYIGFAMVVEGTAADPPDIYADDIEIFTDEEADSYDRIIDDIEE